MNMFIRYLDLLFRADKYIEIRLGDDSQWGYR